MALWKVYNIDTGKSLKAGFDDEEAAKEWLEARHGLVHEDFLVEEMEIEEEEEWLEKNSDDEDAEPITETPEESIVDPVLVAVEVDDDYLDPDEGIVSEVFDEDEEEEEDDAEDEDDDEKF